MRPSKKTLAGRAMIAQKIMEEVWVSTKPIKGKDKTKQTGKKPSASKKYIHSRMWSAESRRTVFPGAGELGRKIKEPRQRIHVTRGGEENHPVERRVGHPSIGGCQVKTGGTGRYRRGDALGPDRR